MFPFYKRGRPHGKDSLPSIWHYINLLHRLRKETGDQRYYAPMEKDNLSLLRLTIISCYRPFRE